MIDLITDHPRRVGGADRPDAVTLRLPGDPSPAVRLAAFAVLLYKYTGQQELVIGLDATAAAEVVVEPAAPFSALASRNHQRPRRPQPDPPTNVWFREPPVTGAELTLPPNEDALHYDAGLFDRASVQRMGRHLRRILQQVTAHPTLPVAEIDLLTDDERARIIGEFNATARPYPRDATIHGLFEDRARRAPERVAIASGPDLMTYGELDERSTRLARRLRAAGMRLGEPVGLLAPRDPALVVAELAILKVGGAYLPIDPGYPPERVEFLLADSGARVLLSTLATPPVRFAGTTIRVDERGPGEDGPGEDGPGEDGGSEPGPSDLAYVIYTSGTTGRPKGVQVSHRNVVRLAHHAEYAQLGEDTRLLATCAPVFDVATFEVWGPLLAGGSVHLVPDEVVLNAAALGSALVEHRIDTMWLTAPLFNQLVEQDPTIFRPLRRLLVGGDVLSPRHIGKVQLACPDLSLVNGYGPTENTTFSTIHPVTSADLERIPIGRPIANSTAYVINADGQLCPIGVPGELCLGGDGVAQGYRNRPQLTAERFVPDPFAGHGRLYRSGDLARWRPDGVLEFFGRRDDQVKVRGFRIELGEIENTLLEHPAVREAVVLAPRGAGSERRLCGYYVARHPVPAAELRAHLRRRLPEHMVPRHLLELPAMPLNASGKVDRGALPEPPASRYADYQAPRDDVEATLVRLAERVLGVRGIGVRHDLRDLGADSLTAAQLAAAAQAELGVRPAVPRILGAGTVERIAGELRSQAREPAPAIPPAPELPSYPLTPQQRRVYVEQCKYDAAVHYNVPVTVDLPAGTDVDRLAAALRTVTEWHDALRTEFAFEGGELRQRVREAVDPPVRMAGTLSVRPFDLNRAPLWRAAIDRGRRGVRLAMDLHHSITDGLSLAVLFDDLAAAYAGTCTGPPPVQYRDYACWRARTELRPEHAAYWQRVFAKPLPGTDLPLDHPRPPIRALDGGTVEFELDRQRTAALRRLARDQDTTLFVVLAAAYTTLLARLTGQADVTVGTPVAGRTAPGLERTLGMFANTVCLRVLAVPDLDFAGYLRTVARTVEDAVAHQDYPLEDLVRQVGADRNQRREYSRTPLFDALIALHSARYLQFDFDGQRVPVRLGWNGQAVFDLNLQLYEMADTVRASWQYSSRLLRRDTVEMWRDGLLVLLDTVLADPHTRIGELTRTAQVRARARTTVPDLDFDL